MKKILLPIIAMGAQCFATSETTMVAYSYTSPLGSVSCITEAPREEKVLQLQNAKTFEKPLRYYLGRARTKCSWMITLGLFAAPFFICESKGESFLWACGIYLFRKMMQRFGAYPAKADQVWCAKFSKKDHNVSLIETSCMIASPSLYGFIHSLDD